MEWRVTRDLIEIYELLEFLNFNGFLIFKKEIYNRVQTFKNR